VNFDIAGIGTGLAGTPGASTANTATWTYTTSALTAGNHSVSAAYTHTGSFQDSSGSLGGGQTVNKANATVVVTPYNVTYDGNPHTAAVTSITGVNGETGATVGTVNVSGTTHTTANTYNDTWTFTGTANYNNIGATPITDVIQKATPTATLGVTNSPQTYTGSPQAATVGITASSVPGAVANILTGGSATKTNAGTYAVTADFVPTDTTNYNSLTGLSAGNFIIQKANPTATLSVTNSPVTYNGSPQSATVSISASSVPGAVVNVKYNGSGTAPTNAATYTVTADFVPTDTTNYNTLSNQSAGSFVSSAVGRCPFIATSRVPPRLKGRAKDASFGSGATARATTVSKGSSSPSASARACTASTLLRPSARAAWLTKRTFLAVASIRVKWRCGLAIASGSPGNPAPVPKSAMREPASSALAERLSSRWAETIAACDSMLVRL